MEIDKYFESSIIDAIRRDINLASQQEIFLVGFINEENRIIDYHLLARGNEGMVPAIVNDLKPGNIIIHNHPSGDLRPSAADIRLASVMGNKGIGFAIINNNLSEIYVVVEPKQPHVEESLDGNEIISLFEDDNKLAEHLHGYEYRQQQIDVVREVVDSFNKHHNILIEAGTGTGKSFAYLIPALYWSYQNKITVVVSTNTINLQEQLIDKDLVLLQKVLPFSFKAVLVKGRSNYVCKRKLHRIEKNAKDYLADLPEKEIEFIKILNWIDQTVTGSRSELNFVTRTDIWDEIASESDLCLRTNCPFFDNCFFMKARKEVFSADLLVANHHLLLSDILLKNEIGEDSHGILPKYRNLIIDEAHNFADVATLHLGRPFYNKVFKKLLDRFFNNKHSLLPRLRSKIAALKVDKKKEILELIDYKLITNIQNLKDMSATYERDLNNIFTEDSMGSIKISGKIKNEELWQEFVSSAEKLLGNINKLIFHTRDLYEEILSLQGLQDDFEDLLIELESYLLRCQHYADNLAFNIKAEDDEFVFWLERRNKDFINQENAPLNITEQLNEMLWNSLDNAVLTSATLSVGNSFAFCQETLGLKKTRNLIVSSPFNYEEQAELIIPEDIPAANSENFLSNIVNELGNILLSFAGRTLVLFTSYKMLNYCLHKLEKSLNANNISILAQGKYARNYIINRFKNLDRQIIFGTVSFWEGVDIKGDNLQYLIIMKLPFPVPDEPIASARMECLRNEGKNPFFHYSLPRAVIRFKQGFGRLIRSKKDKGLVISMDNRILTKSYGKVFQNSLPEGCPVNRVKLKSIAQRGIPE
ncbi:DEAD/DEAH box helicase [Iocasia frigidifontis]|uniref:DNA 5'-3' helicase n=1 Tax=Iocasia fonsfrigidae TaxID=2682810 RepID=A0A8A7K9B6_9FIRM|nr:helicase C-terminal domain-containing protein [Iocasia fonsfrigidae]QTL98403.1 DEAD/DEAH box helicase [Iocasia fonsfrigidae]